MAELRHWHDVCLTTVMWKKFARLFVIKTRFEAWAVIYAITLGAIERGRHYLEVYPGANGYILAAACLGVVFLAGAKLLDAVRPAPAAIKPGPWQVQPRRRPSVTRSRPRRGQPRFGSASVRSLRTD